MGIHAEILPAFWGDSYLQPLTSCGGKAIIDLPAIPKGVDGFIFSPAPGDFMMSRFRRNLIMAGSGGLVAALLLALLSTWLVGSGILRPPFPYGLVMLPLVLVLGGFSLAEIPMMIFTMRRLAAERAENERLVVGLNALYVFFAAVYGVPLTLLTGYAGWGLGLCALSILRFAASSALVREAAL
jgi:hypothetical protein